MIENIISGLLEKFFENPKEWTGFWILCAINLFFLVKYAISHNKIWLLIGFVGICIAIYIMIYLVIMQNI